ncbi:MAG: DUF3160 domain-containing protein [Gammaproteobacteria bacterium]|nr:DUF3160 domain-containing protein [Gammaproteobacteria bacterium]
MALLLSVSCGGMGLDEKGNSVEISLEGLSSPMHTEQAVPPASQTMESFLASHAMPQAFSTAAPPRELTEVRYFDLVEESLQLDASERAQIEMNGFVIGGRWQNPSYSWAYAEVFKRDLPLLVTTDSMLHIWHRLYDDSLEALENGYVAPKLARFLDKVHAQVASCVHTDPACQDVDLYLTVARSLPYVQDLEPVFATNHTLAAQLLSAAQMETADAFTLYGHKREVAFDLMKPLGHYSTTPEGTAYYQAMRWLQLAGFQLVVPTKEGVRFYPRELEAAVRLAQLVESSDSLDDWWLLNSFQAAIAGAADGGTVEEMLLLAQDQGWGGARSASDDPDATIRALVSGNYGRQRLRTSMGHRSQGATTSLAVPIELHLFPRRFTVDADVLQRVTYDQIEHEGELVKRMLPSTLDPIFALGNDAVTPLLAPELEVYPYHDALAEVRADLDAVPELVWKGSFYHHWLDTLRQLNPSHQDAQHLPATLRSMAWQTKLIHTQLASWSELRHDNILYVPPGLGGQITCEYPDVYGV